MAPERAGSLRMKTASATTLLHASESLRILRYEQTLSAGSSIPIVVAPPRIPTDETKLTIRGAPSAIEDHDPAKRDSGLARTSSSVAMEYGNSGDESLPPMVANASSSQASAVTMSSRRIHRADSSNDNCVTGELGIGQEETISKPAEFQTHIPVTSGREFSPITTPIPTEGQLDLDFMDQVTFSQRGSVLLRGKKAIGEGPNEHFWRNSGRRKSSSSMAASPKNTLLSDEIEIESLKVRSMYESQPTGRLENDSVLVNPRNISSFTIKMPAESNLYSLERHDSYSSILPEGTLTKQRQSTDSVRREYELAGGLEDWEDINGQDIDRYGFITIPREDSARPGTPEARRPQRVSTVLQLVSDTPRKRRGFGRTLSSAKSAHSASRRAPSHKASAMSLSTKTTATTLRSPSRQAIRSARNLLPGSQNRRWMDEAGDMLTLPPGLADIAEDVEGGRAAEVVKRKEWDRTEKWHKMAKVVRSGPDGEGMTFDFDTRNPKLIERAWKGIPDRWRAVAWHSFLSTSARDHKGSPTDDQIVRDFYRCLNQSSADDVQIDMDVPRTINSHIMFRKRYRGGQRLLFRVLHALSLYFPLTGYVQGMASLAATLLCYYDEEKTFIMLVRMWQLRGLEKLYAPGFAGLMAALDEFEKQWMNGHDVSSKLDELGINPTAYGTRWYLTLFNYSIPFPAQLRVWDVFMLLGDSDPFMLVSDDRPFQGGLDVLHAASAALIDGTREILLDSDFENSMKVLTSWIPVKDEELFMRVMKNEWRLHHRKGRY
ncbi:MAG: hypothetical protein M1818_000835 [Claussenomyces sp. TS43310]|nr:MAG: hypothetical protein M1818_000835 [Claussenomyces sp. TS43310]